MNINDKFEAIKSDSLLSKDENNDQINKNQKATLITLSESNSNSSTTSLHSSQTNLDNINLNELKSSLNENEFLKYKRQNSANVILTSNSNTPRRMSSLYGNQPIFTNFLYDDLNQDESGSSSSQFKSCCNECGSYTYLTKFNELYMCENCYEKHWQNEINDLLKLKTHLENGVFDLKKYLNAKKAQCNENIKSSQQIKKFITMTMQQIKRKIELELENKRDELFDEIDTFVEDQKKISSSINEDTFQTSEKICDQIENFLLSPENDLNMIKLKSIKTYAKSYMQKLNQQRSSRVPIYSIFFVPDSTVQVNNSFGRIVLKSHDVDSNEDFEDPNQLREDVEYTNNVDSSSYSYNKPSNRLSYNPKWTSSENVFDNMEVLNKRADRRSLNTLMNPKRNKSLFSRGSYDRYNRFNTLDDNQLYGHKSEYNNEKENNDGSDEVSNSMSKQFVPGKVLLSKNSPNVNHVQLTLVNGTNQDSKLKQSNSVNSETTSSSSGLSSPTSPPVQTTNFKKQILNQTQQRLVNF